MSFDVYDHPQIIYVSLLSDDLHEAINTGDREAYRLTRDLLERLDHAGAHEVDGPGGEKLPARLIKESWFTDQVSRDVEEGYDIPPFVLNHVDWDAVADQFLSDYKSIDVNGVTYLHRA